MNVLVVEDEPGAREALVELVKELGYETSAAGSVAEAGAALSRLVPDVCITDLGFRTATASTCCARRRPPDATATFSS